MLIQFVIFNPLGYYFEGTIGFDVKALFASRPLSRLFKWYNYPGDITKEFYETFHGLKITNCIGILHQSNFEKLCKIQRTTPAGYHIQVLSYDIWEMFQHSFFTERILRSGSVFSKVYMYQCKALCNLTANLNKIKSFEVILLGDYLF